jgi:hypothetical protein
MATLWICDAFGAWLIYHFGIVVKAVASLHRHSVLPQSVYTSTYVCMNTYTIHAQSAKHCSCDHPVIGCNRINCMCPLRRNGFCIIALGGGGGGRGQKGLYRPYLEELEVLHYIFRLSWTQYWKLFCDIYQCVIAGRPPLWSSGQSSWLQIQGSRVRFPWHYKKKLVVGLKRGTLSLVSTTE